jgi:acyl-coenzyme A thioesterase PaaI-like protein
MATSRIPRAFAPLRTYTQTIHTNARRTFTTSRRSLTDAPPQQSTKSGFRDLRSQLHGNQSTPPPPPPQSKPFNPRPWLYAALFLAIGSTLGTTASSFIAPATLPSPWSKEDLAHLNILKQSARELKLFVDLERNKDWIHWEAYESMPHEGRESRLTTGPMGGHRGLGYQRVFCNTKTGEFIVLLWLGKALAGWPGVVHGGASATVLDECLARPALRKMEAEGTARAVVTARLELQYKKPVTSGGWYVVRSNVEEHSEGRNGSRKFWCNGSLEDLEGVVHVAGRALYVAPGGDKLKLREIKGNF